MAKFFMILASFMLLSGLFAQTAIIPTAGDGTLTNPYQIANLGNLYWITQDDNRWEFHYIQTADIDASETANWNDEETDESIKEGWLPIEEFEGSYNGGNHSITGLTINRQGVYGQAMFSYVSEGMIKNLHLIGGSIVGGTNTASLVGSLNSSSLIENCSSSANVRGYTMIAGGLVGYIDDSSLLYCHTTGNVRGEESVAGLVGYVNTNSIVQYCYSTGNVRGSSKTGGFVGQNTNNALIQDCYSLGDVARDSAGFDPMFGGFCGYLYNSQIKNCFSKGRIHYLGEEGPVNKGFIGWVATGTQVTTDNYWDITTSQQTSTGGEEGQYAWGKTTDQMKQQATFLNWNFEEVWDIEENTSYPFLREQPTDNNDIQIPAQDNDLFISAIYPNPLKSGSTLSIEYQLKNNVSAEMIIFNIKGQMVQKFTNLTKGSHSIVWNGKNDLNQNCPSGIYFCQIKSNNKSIAKKMILLK